MAKKNKKEKFPGYPKYPESDDIYNRAKEETEVDPEETDKLKEPVEENQLLNELDFDDDVFIDDLDVPGADLDDDQEDIGNEDEENNLYSLGGDKD